MQPHEQHIGLGGFVGDPWLSIMLALCHILLVVSHWLVLNFSIGIRGCNHCFSTDSGERQLSMHLHGWANEWMNDQYTPLLVYCYATGLPPLASRPARTALLSPVGPEGCSGTRAPSHYQGHTRHPAIIVHRVHPGHSST
jgi:hypothetical protein